MNQVILTTAIVLLMLSGSWGCKTSREAVKDYPQPPSWVSERPVNTGYYYGVGSAPKRGSAQIYRQIAAEKALSDIAGQIATQIESEASMYRVEDKFGVRETYETRIKAQSADFLEGQEVIDEYQNEQNYYVLYRLSAQTYEQKRNARKKSAFETAEQLYHSGIQKADEGEYQLSVHYLLKAIENIYPFRGEKTWIVEEKDTIDLFNHPLEKLKSISESLRISASTTETNIINQQFNGKGVTYIVQDHLDRKISEVPILFSVNGGYLLNNRAKTDANGTCQAPPVKVLEKQDSFLLAAKIDLSQWVNHSTEIMEIRNLMKKWTVARCEIELAK